MDFRYSAALLNEESNWDANANLTEEERKDRDAMLAEQQKKKNQEVSMDKSLIYDRLAELYVKLFGRVSKWKDKDDFFWNYPDLVSQSIYVLFCDCFPLSLDTFNVEMKIKICDTVGEWFLGRTYWVR